MKAVAIHVLAIIIMTVMFLVAILTVFGIWSDFNTKEVTKASCLNYILRYCEDWLSSNFEGNPPAWKGPEISNCMELGIEVPPTAETCRLQV